MTFEELDKILIDHGFIKYDRAFASYIKTLDAETNYILGFTNTDSSCALCFADKESIVNHVYHQQLCITDISRITFNAERDCLVCDDQTLPLN